MKKLILSISLVLLLLSIPLSVSAHAGKTDSQGGHTDWSTGEYHYHHGYPAHDHFDMDGDGILDCPYDFDDKTNHSSSGSSSSGYNGYSLPAIETRPLPTFPKPTDSTVPIKPQSQNESGEETMSSFWKFLIFFLIITIVILIIKIRTRNKDILFLREGSERRMELLKKEHEEALKKKDDQINTLRNSLLNEKAKSEQEAEKMQEKEASEIKAMRQDIKESLVVFDAIFKQNCGKEYLSTLLAITKGDYVGEDGLPASADGAKTEWGEKYTFYLSSINGKKYHRKNCHYVSIRSVQENAYTLYNDSSQFEPCRKCNPALPDLTWYIRYRMLSEFKDKYLK